jgi:pimeloyl-ACP methyl ester carboxylesterase
LTESLRRRRTSNSIRTPERDSGSTLAYEVVGSGPPLILLHGLSGSGRWWSRNVPAFARSFRTYTVDLPGFGQSRRVRWSRLDDIADRIAGWVADEGLPRVHIAGHSLGGAVAARLAARHPDRIDRLVLVDAAIRPEGMRPTPRPVGLTPTIRLAAPGVAPLLVRDLLRCHPRSFITATVDALQTDWDSLARINAPTLVVWGARDAITPLALGRDITAVVSGARLITLAEAGHNPMWECAEAFNTEVLHFLADGMAPRSNACHDQSSRRPGNGATITAVLDEAAACLTAGSSAASDTTVSRVT